MQTIKLDISQKNNVPLLYVKQRDVGHKFAIDLYENGKIYTVDENYTCAVWYSGESGEGNYTHIGEKVACEIEGNKITVEMIVQMLNEPGGHEMCVVVYDQYNKQKGFWNIPYFVEAIPGADSKAATVYYQAFLQAREGAEAAAGRAEESMQNAKADADRSEDAAARSEKAAEDTLNAAESVADKKPQDVIVTATFDTVVSDTISTGAADISAFDVATAISKGATVTLIDDDNRVYKYDGYRLEPNYSNAFFEAQEIDSNGIITHTVNINNEGQASRTKSTKEYGVLYTAQDLTPERQAQARKNIGVEDAVLEVLVSLGIAPVLLDADGSVLCDTDGSILVNN